jgi:D-alanyl-lipoteichoic acid acyltransferase DltB (MBOAT superfamily)
MRPSAGDIFKYALRWIVSFLTLEVLLHYFYVVAIKDNQAWLAFKPLDFAALAYLNLTVVWLKLLIIWRFFRLVALLDGIVPLENIARCMSNNYSSLAFWRGWHRSFNKWIVRYMYIPLGGSKTALYNIWPIFTFVAIWHDIHLNMLLWSWLICLLILPEIVLSWLAQKRGWEGPQYRHWIAAAAGANMFLMGVANLVGFVVGVSGIQTILGSLTSASGMLFSLAMAGTCYCAGHVLLEIRATERSYGIFNKY